MDGGETQVIVGRVRTMDEARTEAEAIALRGDTILAVGAKGPVLATAGRNASIVDTSGATVLPGFIDAHHHVSLSSLYGGAARLTPPQVTDIASLQAALSEASTSLEAGRWLVAMDWDESQLAERRAPRREELDEAVPDRPLFALHYTCHRALANSRALELAGIDAKTADPSGGLISRGRGGLPDGLLVERGMSRVEALARPDLAAHDTDGYLDRMAEHYRRIVAVGITRVADTTVPLDLIPLYRRAVERGEVLVPTMICPVSTSGYLEAPWDVLDGPVTGHEEGPLTIGPVKLVFDGAPGCAMCLSWWQSVGAMAKTVALAVSTGSLDPLRTTMSIEPRYGAKVRTGIAIYRREEAQKILAAMAERGFGAATHAIGNEAVEMVLDAYEAVGTKLHGGGLPRIEHGVFLDRELVRRVAGGGFAVVCQPAMLAMHGTRDAVTIPGLPFKPLRWLLDAGVCVSGSSDYPVTGFDPLDGIRTACSRVNARGVIVNPDQRVTLDEAIAMYTRGSATACGALDRCGTLEVGKRADLVVVDGDLERPEARVRATVVGGRVVHGAIGASEVTAG